VGDNAFTILGIEPTTDGRAIRAAFLRLARIYHPDRYVDQPDDVRAEAERRMKDATIAYDSLRATKHEKAERPKIDDKELRDRALKYRETMEAKAAENKRNRVRWRRWEELERQARERQELEAQIAETIARDVEGPLKHTSNGHSAAKAEEKPKSNGKASSKSELSQRLDAARRGETSPLVPRESVS